MIPDFFGPGVPVGPPKDYADSPIAPSPHTELIGPETPVCPHDDVQGNFNAITTSIAGVIVMHFTAHCAKCGAKFCPLGIPVAPENQALARRPSMSPDMHTVKLPMVIQGHPTRITRKVSLARIESRHALG